MIRRPPRSTLFPSTPLSRSEGGSLPRCFVARPAEIMRLDVPATPRAERLSTPILQADRLDVPDVIVVEDDPALAELLESGLRWRAYRLGSYRNGREALPDLLALATGGAHPLLLLDVDLPGLDGYSIFEALGRERPGVYRVVFTTVHGDEGEQLRGLEAGALDYLVKPIDRKSTRLNSSHVRISYAVFCLKKKKGPS